jgi:hypothetical protein
MAEEYFSANIRSAAASLTFSSDDKFKDELRHEMRWLDVNVNTIGLSHIINLLFAIFNAIQKTSPLQEERIGRNTFLLVFKNGFSFQNYGVSKNWRTGAKPG